MAGAPLGTVPDSGNESPGRYAWFVFAVIAALGFVDWLSGGLSSAFFPS